MSSVFISCDGIHDTKPGSKPMTLSLCSLTQMTAVRQKICSGVSAAVASCLLCDVAVSLKIR